MKRTKHKIQKRIILEVLHTGKPDKPYDPEFVAKILQGERDIAEGRTVKLELDDIWSLVSKH